MAVEETPQELSNNIFRTATLSLFNIAGGQADFSKQINGVQFKQADGRYMVAMSLPDGTREYWAQVNAAYDPVSGFKAMAFERRNQDGSTYIQNGQPQVMVSFPGNTSTKEDLDTSRAVVYGKSDRYFTSRAEFMGRVADGMTERQKIHGQGIGEVKIGAHSIGSTAAIGAAQDLEAKGIKGTKTYLLEPVGAGQAVQQYAPILAAKRAGANQPTQAHVDQAASDLSQVISVRANKNMFQNIGGDQANDNAAPGTTYYLEVSKNSLLAHQALNAAQVLLAGNKPVRTADKDIVPKAFLDGGRTLDDTEVQQARLNADSFIRMVSKNGFNTVAASPGDERANAQRANFVGMGPAQAVPSAQAPQPAPAQTPAPQSVAAPVAKAPVAESKDAIEIVRGYLKEKGYEVGAGSGWNKELNDSFARSIAEAQLLKDYKTAFQSRYNRSADGVDFMPGPATRAAMAKNGMPEDVLAALDEMKMFDRLQGNDLYTPPADQVAMDILKQARETPIAFVQPKEETVVASSNERAMKMGGANLQ